MTLSHMKLHITAVLNPANNLGEEIVDEVLAFCQEKAITFTTREYDSLRYSKDRDFILRLPAFHIYAGSIYINTFHTDYLEHIHQALSMKVRTLKGAFQRFIWRIGSLCKNKV